MNNFFKKFWFKLFDKNKYWYLKNQERTASNIKYYNSHIYSKILEIQKKIENNKELSFLHSGRIGDLIYSLATIKELSKSHKCKLYVQIEKPDYGSSRKFFISKNSGDLLLPLLRHQDFLDEVNIYKDEKIDINLDLFREIPINRCFFEPRWFSHICGVNLDLENTYLSVKPHQSIKDKIIVGRSPRYRNSYLNYKFLKDTKNLLCIGLKEEYQDLKKEINNLEFYDCKDFLEMAQIINASKIFIGNLSFGFTLAEGLKKPRLLESGPNFPLVYPNGKNAYDFYFQKHFEKNFQKLYSNE